MTRICRCVKHPRHHSRVDRLLVDEIEDKNLLFLLPDAIDPTDSLLDLHWIPRQVEVDNCRTKLEVEPLGGNLVRENEFVGTRPEVGHNPSTIIFLYSAVKHRDAKLVLKQRLQFGKGRP